jgi:hypothetical protein
MKIFQQYLFITMKIALPNANAFLILLSEIPVYGVLTHADKQRLNDSQYIDGP